MIPAPSKAFSNIAKVIGWPTTVETTADWLSSIATKVSSVVVASIVGFSFKRFKRISLKNCSFSECWDFCVCEVFTSRTLNARIFQTSF